jgi:signal transduction histidine kinase/CheY-like chemotaxis protein
MEKSKKQYDKMLKGSSMVMIAIIVFALVILLVTMIFSYYNQLDEKLFEERKLHLIEFTEKASEIVEETVDSSWRELNACNHVLMNEGQYVKNKKDLLDLLESMGDFLDAERSMVLVFDEKGTYYSSDGNSGYWEDNSVLTINGDESQQAIVEIPHIKSGNFLFFVESISGLEIEDSGRKLTHLAIAINSDSMREQLSISGFGNECYSYIVNNNGRRLYQYTYENNFISGYNIFDSISKYKVLHGGSFELFHNTVSQSGESMALEFAYEDEQTGTQRDWFVANANIVDVGWHILLFVPSDILGAGTDDLIKETTQFFLIISIIIVVIFILMMFVIISGRADKKMIKQKEESNILLAEAAKKAESASLAKSDFLSHMSHDIRTPINAIIGMTGIAIKYIDNKEKVTDCLRKIDSSSQHLFSLINDVLDMSRIESGKVTMVKESFNLGVCLVNCASIIEGQIATRDIELVQDFEEVKNLMVLGDELHLRQIFINILGNSVKFTPDGGKIYFRAEKIENDGNLAFRFLLEDTGIGMKADYLPHLFESFTQEDNGSRTTYKGTGLGMAIVKQFVDMMNGTIEVESTLNVGTKFIVTIPMEIDSTVKQEREKEEQNFNLQGMKVLVVEDNDLNLEIAQELLEEQGILVTAAENGQVAVDLFEQSPPGAFDAILMDVMMPVMDGLTATRTIRASTKPDAKTLPILAMTANAYDEDMKKTKEAGMNSHLSKPINPSMLCATLDYYYKKKKEEGK